MMQPLSYSLHLADDDRAPATTFSGPGRLVRQVIGLLVAVVFITADWLVAVREKSSRARRRR